MMNNLFSKRKNINYIVTYSHSHTQNYMHKIVGIYVDMMAACMELCCATKSIIREKGNPSLASQYKIYFPLHIYNVSALTLTGVVIWQMLATESNE